MRWEATQVKKSYKPAETVYAVRDTTFQPETLSYEEVEAFARKNGYTVRPAARQENYRRPEGPRHDSYQRQEGPRPNTYDTRPPPRDKSQVLCWHCGKYGHYSRECTGKDKTYRFAPPRNERPPRNIGINRMDTDECDSISTHSSIIPPGDLKV